MTRYFLCIICALLMFSIFACKNNEEIIYETNIENTNNDLGKTKTDNSNEIASEENKDICEESNVLTGISPVLSVPDINYLNQDSEKIIVEWKKDEYSAKAEYDNEKNLCKVSYYGKAGKIEELYVNVVGTRVPDMMFCEVDTDNDGISELVIRTIVGTGTGYMKENILMYDFSDDHISSEEYEWCDE